MSWNSDFKIFTGKLCSLSFRWIQHKIPDSENEAKQNRYEFLSTSSITKYLVDFEKMVGFYRPFCLFISKSIHFLAHPSLNVSSILLFNDLVMVTNEGVYCLQTFQKKKHMGIFPLLSHILFHIWNISNIACNKKPLKLKFSLLTNSNLIEFTEKYLEKLLIWNSYKWTTVGAQNSNRNAVFSWKM